MESDLDLPIPDSSDSDLYSEVEADVKGEDAPAPAPASKDAEGDMAMVESGETSGNAADNVEMTGTEDHLAVAGSKPPPATDPLASF